MHCYPKPLQQEENEDQILDFIVFGVDRCFTHPNSWSIFKNQKKHVDMNVEMKCWLNVFVDELLLL